MAEQEKTKDEQVQFLLLGGHIVTGEITQTQLGALMTALSVPHERRNGYVRIDESISYEMLVPHSDIVAVRYKKAKEE